MIQKLKLMVLSLSSLFLFAAPLAVSGVASAASGDPTTQQDINQKLCSGSNIDFTGKTTCTQVTGTGEGATSLARTVINVLSLIVGAVAVIMLIFGGFRYVTSGGKQESVTAAKNTIIYALIGLVIVAVAQIVVQFVLTKTTTAIPQ
jgi:hypothetical protein